MTDPPPKPEHTNHQEADKQPNAGGYSPPDTSRAKIAFLAHMRHELRTPINAIMGYSELLLEDAEHRSHQGFVADLQRINAAGKQLLTLVNSLLDQSKIESQQDINIGEFEAQVRHALRTPLTAVIGYVDIITEDASEAHNDDLVPDLQKIRSSAERMLALVSDILSLWQIEAGKLNLDDNTTKNYQMVREAVASIRPLSEDLQRTSLVRNGFVLVVDDNEINRDLLYRHLQREGHSVAVAENGREALKLLNKENFDLVLLDILMPEMNGYQLLTHLKADEALRHIPVIMLSALDDMDSVVRCIELGADDYLPKPFNPVLLRARIDSCLEKKRRRDQELAYLEQVRVEREKSLRDLLKDQGPAPAQIPGGTRMALQLRSQTQAAASNNLPLLILGEPGTEKRMLAQMVHEKSLKSAGPFLRLDCADVPAVAADMGSQAESLLKELAQMSALFGHQSGAFSFARSNRAGYLELAEGGTLLLENIERLTPAVQQRLLAYIQTGKLCRLGSPHEMSGEVRVIATSHARLGEAAKSGAFDAELFRALSGQAIVVPALKERKRDLMDWVEHFLQTYAAHLGKNVSGVTKEAMNLIMAYDWPNNVEELESVIQRGIRLADGPMLTPEQIFIGLAPIEPRHRIDLLKIPILRKVFESRSYPGLFQVFSVAALVIILLFALFGPKEADRNVAMLLVWGLGWPLLLPVIFFSGRFFCSVCPMGATGRFLQRRWSLKLKVPTLLRKYGLYWAALGFLLIFWTEQVTGMAESPIATFLLLVTILSASVGISLLFERAAWCRFMCPLGRMVGTYATLSTVEIRSNPAVCNAECKTHGCYTGTELARSCPMYEGAFALQSNEACKFCGDCIKNCPNKAIRVNLRPPVSELWTVPQHSLALATLVPILMATVLSAHLRGTDFYQQWLNDFQLERLVYLGITILIVLVLWGAMALTTVMMRDPFAGGLSWVPYAFLPLAFAGEMGHQTANLLSRVGYILPAMTQQLSLGDGPVAYSEASATTTIQVVLLAIGFLVSTYVGHRLVRRYAPSSGLAVRLPVFVLAAVISLLYGVLFLES